MSHAQKEGSVSLFGNLTDIVVDGRTKGMPGELRETPLGDLAGQGWNILRRDLPMPVAVLNRAALEQNSSWINAVTSHYRVSLCPHGKTTMSPQLFRKQLDDGCWGITLSTPHQVHVARHYGTARIFLANQIMDRRFLAYIADAQIEAPELDFYFLVDSERGIDLLEEVASERPRHQPFQVLIEMGSPFARAGCRTQAEAITLAERIARSSRAAVLTGIEGFEGSIRGADGAEVEHRIKEFLTMMADTATRIAQAGLFSGREILLTAGGSAYFDLVARSLIEPAFASPSRVVLRSGCYIAHDAGMYDQQVARAIERSPELATVEPKPRQALTVWAAVQSRPAADLLFLNAGRRDLSYDAHLPRPLRYASGYSSSDVHLLNGEHEVTMLNDQHAYVRCPPDSPVQPGDIMELGISHPCTTFDKWDVICVVDGELNVVDAVKTFF